MNYQKENIKPGVNFHIINTNKFKTNLFSIFITTKLNKDTVTKNALLTAVLRRGSKNYQTQEIISQNLENLYGASFDCGVEKSGDNHLLKFYLESINNEFLPTKENLSKECFEILCDIVFNPFIENEKFKEEYIQGEKENMKQIIQSKIDNKATYASDRCIEEMYKGEAYGLYKFGYVEDLEEINAQNLYEYYKELMKTAKIDIFISGDLDEETIRDIKNSNAMKNVPETAAEFNLNNGNVIKKEINEPKVINESMQVTQGKLIIGLDLMETSKESKYIASVYNVILGGSSNSKLFQNVREKASLAYTAGSVFLKQKNNIIIKAGIDIPNYDKAVKLIKEQLEQMKNGDFQNQEIENAKLIISSSVESIPETQDSEIIYYFSQELSGELVSIDEYIKNINSVTKEQIVDIANKIQINTIYFLKD